MSERSYELTNECLGTRHEYQTAEEDYLTPQNKEETRYARVKRILSTAALDQGHGADLGTRGDGKPGILDNVGGDCSVKDTKDLA